MRALSRCFGLFVVFAGCSGGGSNRPPTLQITTMQPPPGATVEVDSRVAVAFGTVPDPATLTAGAFEVRDASGPLPGSLSYDASSRTWTWAPGRELPRGALLTARVAGSVRGASGEVVGDGGLSWKFRVRAGVPGAPVEIGSGVVTTGDDLFVGMLLTGEAVVALDASAWPFGPSGVGPAEHLPGGRVRGLQVDAAGGAAAMMIDGSGPNVAVNVTRRAPNGIWTAAETVTGIAAGSLQRSRFLGNDAGDLMVHLDIGQTSFPNAVSDEIHWSAAGTSSWQSLPLLSSPIWFGRLSSMDGSGRVATMHRDGEFVIVQRQEPALGTVLTYTVAQGPFFSVGGLGVSVDGRLRAIWHEPGQVTRQRFAAFPAAFDQPAQLPIFVPVGSSWKTAATGATVGWSGNYAFRSEAGSDAWATAFLAATPMAVAISPRGEAVMLWFELPDAWWIARWRAGEPIDAPLRVATITSQFNGFREAALAVDARGRVVVAIVPESPGRLLAVLVE